MAICGKPEFVIWLDAANNVLYERLVGRTGYIDRKGDYCKAVQSQYWSVDHSSLDIDQSQIITARLETYHDAIKPLETYFEEVGIPIFRFNASGTIEEIAENIFHIPQLTQMLIHKNC